LYDANLKTVDVHTALCTTSQQPEMVKIYRPCSTVGADGRTTGLEQLFSAQITWNISGTVSCQVSSVCLIISNFQVVFVLPLLPNIILETK
jgi:hypothetical protein